MGHRKHDDAHRPLGGVGQRGNKSTGATRGGGGAELLTAPTCERCGVMKLRQAGTWHCDGCGEANRPHDQSDSANKA